MTFLYFLVVIAMYVPVCFMGKFFLKIDTHEGKFLGYLTYGDSLRDSVINSIQIKWIQQTINIAITAHLILSLTIVFNPLNQEVEEFFKIPLSKPVQGS